MCFAAKWVGNTKVQFAAAYEPVDGKWVPTDSAKDKMLSLAYSLLDDADIVVHYNGMRFDMPHLNREFAVAELGPPSPYQQIDLLRQVKKQFNFPSNKLAYVTKALSLSGKMGNSGHQLWVECLAGIPKAWAQMRRYNKQDVVVTEELYHRILPWVSGHPSVGLFSDPPVSGCANCGSMHLRPRGRAYTARSIFQRYRCDDCGKWQRGSSRIGSVSVA